MINRVTKMPRPGNKTITIDMTSFEDARDGAYILELTVKEFTATAIEQYIKQKNLRKRINDARKLKAGK